MVRIPIQPLLLLSFFTALPFAGGTESKSDYLQWDGKESVADYARRVKLSPTRTVDLGNGVNLELVLIPAGKFMMGTPVPVPIDEDGLDTKIVTGEALLAFSALALLVMFIVTVIKAMRQRRRPQFSLRFLLLVTITAGGCVLSGLHWWQSEQNLETARALYVAELTRFNRAAQDEKPAHPVTLTSPFYMGKFSITREQYEAVLMRSTSSVGNYPMDSLDWEEAQKFIRMASEQTKQTFRLPTEAEWEYACRAGTTTEFYSGDMISDLARVAWYSTNSGGMHPVGQKPPNAFGLYDMHGNTWQWCQDWYSPNYYQVSESQNPQGPAESQEGFPHALRGGSNARPFSRCRSASREGNGSDGPVNVGFRVVLTAVAGSEH